MSEPSKRAFVLGGGIAGIAAALALRDRGLHVELFEARAQLGGRVFSFADARLGTQIDNGPHVMLGCYERMRALLRRLGSEDAFARRPGLHVDYRERGGRATSLRLSRWPTPLAMPWAIVRHRPWSRGERGRALRGMLSSLRSAPATSTLEDWLVQRRQHGAPRAFLWEPLCLAIMNADPREVQAALFLRTLRRAFSGSAARAAIWIPTRPWSEIVADPARRTLEHLGVRVHLGRRAEEIELAGANATALVGAGQRLALAPGDIVVTALPWHRLAALLPRHAGPAGALVGRDIVNVVFDGGDPSWLPMAGPLVALVNGAPFQFVYRRPGDRSGRITLIAGAATQLDGISADAIAGRAREQLQSYYPEVAIPASIAFRITKEPSATLLVSPQSATQRPAPGRLGELANVYVCGDWTDTDLPSTLEGAAESAARMAKTLR